MNIYCKKSVAMSIRKLISSFVAVTFIVTMIVPPNTSYAQMVLNLPVPGTMVMPTEAFSPMTIRGINIHPENAMMFDFIIDEGDTSFGETEFNQEAQKLVKYFMASLTVPQEEMWVNLSPYEKDRIIADSFGNTEMGRDLLAQDYMLKQLTSSMLYPEDDLGQEFWQRVYEKAEAEYGTTDIPLDTFNKIWIVPETAKIYEHSKGAFVVESKLKVMLEEDYIALEANQGRVNHGIGDVKAEDLRSVQDVSVPIIRELVIPEIEREVNEGEIFSNLRQIHNAMILAKWYKERLHESILGQVYVDQGKTNGVNTDDPEINQKIYEQYVSAFKKGVFDFIREDYSEVMQEVVPRKYFSGGYAGNHLESQSVKTFDPAMLGNEFRTVTVRAQSVGDKAMLLNLDVEREHFSGAVAFFKAKKSRNAISEITVGQAVETALKHKTHSVLSEFKSFTITVPKSSFHTEGEDKTITQEDIVFNADGLIEFKDALVEAMWNRPMDVEEIRFYGSYADSAMMDKEVDSVDSHADSIKAMTVNAAETAIRDGRGDLEAFRVVANDLKEESVQFLVKGGNTALQKAEKFKMDLKSAGNQKARENIQKDIDNFEGVALYSFRYAIRKVRSGLIPLSDKAMLINLPQAKEILRENPYDLNALETAAVGLSAENGKIGEIRSAVKKMEDLRRLESDIKRVEEAEELINVAKEYASKDIVDSADKQAAENSLEKALDLMPLARIYNLASEVYNFLGNVSLSNWAKREAQDIAMKNKIEWYFEGDMLVVASQKEIWKKEALILGAEASWIFINAIRSFEPTLVKRNRVIAFEQISQEIYDTNKELVRNRQIIADARKADIDLDVEKSKVIQNYSGPLLDQYASLISQVPAVREIEDKREQLMQEKSDSMEAIEQLEEELDKKLVYLKAINPSDSAMLELDKDVAEELIKENHRHLGALAALANEFRGDEDVASDLRIANDSHNYVSTRSSALAIADRVESETIRKLVAPEKKNALHYFTKVLIKKRPDLNLLPIAKAMSENQLEQILNTESKDLESLHDLVSRFDIGEENFIAVHNGYASDDGWLDIFSVYDSENNLTIHLSPGIKDHNNDGEWYVEPFRVYEKENGNFVSERKGLEISIMFDRGEFNIERDSAMVSDDNFVKGGIDFNSDISSFTIEHNGEGFVMPELPQALIEQYNSATGFVPVIINVAPIQSLPMILGMIEEEEDVINAG